MPRRIAPPPSRPRYTDVRGALETIGIAGFRVSYTDGSLPLKLSILAGPDSLTVLPCSAVFMRSHMKLVTTVPAKLEHPERALGLVWFQDRPIRPSAPRLSRYLEAEFQGLANLIEQ